MNARPVKLGFWRRLMCKLSLCDGHVDREKDEAGTWWIGLRCATCLKLNCREKSRYQDKP